MVMASFPTCPSPVSRMIGRQHDISLKYKGTNILKGSTRYEITVSQIERAAKFPFPPLKSNRNVRFDHRRTLRPVKPPQVLGSELDNGNEGNQNKNGQCNGLCDCERWLGLRRSQRSESRDFHEALHDQNKYVKIKGCDGGDHVNPAPRADQVLFVQSIQRD